MAPKVTLEYKQEVREKIFEAAETLFSRKGYYDTSMDEIVKESGLSKGAIYGYFKSKQELLLALQDRDLSSSLARIKASFSPDDSASKKLQKAAQIAFSFLVGKSRQACRMSLEFGVAAPRMKSLMSRQDNRYEVIHNLVAEIVEEGIQTGEFRKNIDVDATASILIAIVDGLAFHWATTSHDLDWKKLENQVRVIVLQGLLAGR
jgi:AcrR family transcriptional regulator